MLSRNAKAFSVESLLMTDSEINTRLQANGAGADRLIAHSESGTKNESVICPVGPPSVSGSRCYHSPIQSLQGDALSNGRVSLELFQDELWQCFHDLGTEMIITKSGRRMFPAIRVRFHGLDPNKLYNVSLNFTSIDKHKYRYIYYSSKWMVAGPGDTTTNEQRHEHQENPMEGSFLCSQVTSFERVKLTNCSSRKEGQVALVSMQKFQPRIHLSEITRSVTGDATDVTSSEILTFVFPQTSFMAVTAYQNQEITRLKIARNPFAKGFREAGKNRTSLDTIMASFNSMAPKPCLTQRRLSLARDQTQRNLYKQSVYPQISIGHDELQSQAYTLARRLSRHDSRELELHTRLRPEEYNDGQYIKGPLFISGGSFQETNLLHINRTDVLNHVPLNPRTMHFNPYLQSRMIYPPNIAQIPNSSKAFLDSDTKHDDILACSCNVIPTVQNAEPTSLQACHMCDYSHHYNSSRGIAVVDDTSLKDTSDANIYSGIESPSRYFMPNYVILPYLYSGGQLATTPIALPRQHNSIDTRQMVHPPCLHFQPIPPIWHSN